MYKLHDYQSILLDKMDDWYGNVSQTNSGMLVMPTGTGKTLVAAAIIRLFLRTENARRVLFLVDRLDLENQALKSFTNYLRPDFTTFIYKEHKIYKSWLP